MIVLSKEINVIKNKYKLFKNVLATEMPIYHIIAHNHVYVHKCPGYTINISYFMRQYSDDNL